MRNRSKITVMKKCLLVLFATILSNTTFVLAQGIEFFEGTWEEALMEASKEEKLIFVDAYAEWCGPCKRMARNVFTQDEVGEFYNKNFINLKVDMEKPQNRDFSKKYPAAAFPTLYYIDFTGEVVQNIKGAQTVENFIKLGKSALSKTDRSDFYAAAYEEGDRSPELIYNYVKALNKVGKSSLKIANAYLDTQDDLRTQQNLKFILEATANADSRIFDLLIKNRDAITSMTSKQVVEDKIEQACKTTLDRAIEYESEDLLLEAQQKMKQHLPDRAAAFTYESEMLYAKLQNDDARYLKGYKKYIAKVANGDATEICNQSLAMVKAFPSATTAAIAEKNCKKAVKGNDFIALLTYAELLKTLQKNTAAKKMALRALQVAEEQQIPNGAMLVKQFMNGL